MIPRKAKSQFNQFVSPTTLVFNRLNVLCTKFLSINPYSKMKKMLVVALMLLAGGRVGNAQTFRGLDKSTMDVAYCPDNFAHDRKLDDKALVKVTYTRPAKKEREIIGKLVPFGQLWRVGANEATEVKLYQDVTIMGKPVKAGTYTLYMTPTKTEWTIVLNKQLDVWGTAFYDAKNDVLSVKVAPKHLDTVVENLSIQFTKVENKQSTLQLAWENTLVELPISF